MRFLIAAAMCFAASISTSSAATPDQWLDALHKATDLMFDCFEKQSAHALASDVDEDAFGLGYAEPRNCLS
jgi:hypothetical protein